MSLKPQNIIQAADADLRRLIRNKDANRGARQGGSFEHYAFHRAHVRRAKSTKRLLLLALMHPPLKVYEDGSVSLQTRKFNTRMIYGNAGLLVAALKMLGD